VLDMLAAGADYSSIATELGISPGLAHLIATGVPADGGDTVTTEQRRRPGIAGSRGQLLVHSGEQNPTKKPDILEWLRRRATSDPQQRAAGEGR
jgi:hypothetical protein